MIIGSDVGGTHTDAVLLGSMGLAARTKVTTDEADLYTSVLAALDAVLEGMDPAVIRRVVLSAPRSRPTRSSRTA